MAHIHVQAQAGSGLFEALIDGDTNGHVGASPDEALGNAVRQLWLAETGCVVVIALTYESPYQVSRSCCDEH